MVNAKNFPRLLFVFFFSFFSSFISSAGDVFLNFTSLTFYSSQIPFTGALAGELFRSRLEAEKSWFDGRLNLLFRGDVEYAGGDKDFLSLYTASAEWEKRSYALPLQSLTLNKSHYAVFLRIYRLTLEGAVGPITVKAGRQFIDWGKGYFFFLLNPFTPPTNISAEPSQIPGVDGVSVRGDITDFISVEAVWALKFDNHLVGLNFGGYWKGLDFNFIYWWDGEHLNGGVSCAFNLFDGTFRAEVLVPRRLIDVLLGYDRYIGEGFEIRVEYFLHLSEGRSSPEEYEFNKILKNPPSDPAGIPQYLSRLKETYFRYLPGTGKLGQHYAGLLLSKTLNFPLILSLGFEMNLSDDSYVFIPVLKWEPAEWIEISTGGILGAGNENTEFEFVGKSFFILVEIFG